jgi:F0F1-type ATP synthase membrane subunit b/b'
VVVFWAEEYERELDSGEEDIAGRDCYASELGFESERGKSRERRSGLVSRARAHNRREREKKEKREGHERSGLVSHAQNIIERKREDMCRGLVSHAHKEERGGEKKKDKKKEKKER